MHTNFQANYIIFMWSKIYSFYAFILKVQSINIGDRQEGRTMMSSVICCKSNTSAINQALNTLLLKKNRKKINFINQKKLRTKFEILSILKKVSLVNIKKKRFIDNI